MGEEKKDSLQSVIDAVEYIVSDYENSVYGYAYLKAQLDTLKRYVCKNSYVERDMILKLIRLYAKMCKDNNCYACPVYEKSGECGCEEFAINHPEEVIESLKQWKEDHEKKPIETEHVMCIVVMDEKRNVVYEEKTNGVIVTTDMEEVLKKYCSEHDGKYYAISERRCVVKE